MKGALLSLLKVELLMSIVELQGKSSILLLKEANHGLALSNCRLKCVNLALSLIQLGIEINNELISGVDHLMVGLCQLSELGNSIALGNLKAVQCIQAPSCRVDCARRVKSSKDVRGVHPLQPQRISLVDCWK